MLSRYGGESSNTGLLLEGDFVGNTSVGVGIAVLGILLAVAGAFLYTYEETESYYWGFYSETTQPYQDIGIVLLVLGIVIIVVGAIVSVIPSRPSSPLPPSYQPTYQPSGQGRFCSYCGKPLAPNAVYCPGCGRSPPK